VRCSSLTPSGPVFACMTIDASNSDAAEISGVFLSTVQTSGSGGSPASHISSIFAISRSRCQASSSSLSRFQRVWWTYM
jgi:hypothetical protein